ncbi:hypothetical protein SESBI_15899 [Sesbania bispinosa]|nr:hypothetical protein SESBI_15899 [Sesbania bispinosa]
MKGGSSSTEKKSFRCISSTSSSHPRFRRCRCGEKVILLTSNTSSNPDRNFWRQEIAANTSSGQMRKLQKMYQQLLILQLMT